MPLKKVQSFPRAFGYLVVSLFTRLSELKGAALDLLFPRWCTGCGRKGDLMCKACSEALPHLLPPPCSRCRRPLSGGAKCPSCQGGILELEGLRSPFRLEAVVRQAVHHLKCKNVRAPATPLAQLLADYLSVSLIPRPILVPVPLRPRRQERGYNQSSLLAQELGRLIGSLVVTGSPLSQRVSLAQAKATATEARRSNVADACACRDGRLRGREVFLTDDVCTTGATLNCCAEALKAAGAASVWGV
jgi:ComF family protein